MLTGKSKIIQSFETPEAFVYIYEREQFISLSGGKVMIFDIEGEIITNFGNKILYGNDSIDVRDRDLES
jgi:hypothetical protein